MSTPQSIHPTSSEASSASGALTPEFIADLRANYVMSTADRACHNAVTNNEVNSLALNRDVVRGDSSSDSVRSK